MKPYTQRTVLRYIYLHVIIALTVFALGLTYWVWEDAKNDRYNDLSYTTKVIRSYYMISLRQWELSLLSVGLRLIEIEGPDRDERRLEFAKKALNDYDQLLAFGLADTTGQVTTFTDSQIGDSLPQLMVSEKTRRSFIYAKSAKRMTIGEVYYFDRLADWVIPFRVPIKNEEGSVVAVNTSAIELKSLVKELSSFGFDPRYRIHLVNRAFNSNQLYYPLHPIYYQTVLRSHDSVVFNNWKVTSSHEKTFMVSGFNNIEGHEFIGVSTPLEGFDHDLIISVDKEVIKAQFWSTTWIIIISYIVLMILISLLFRFFKKKEMAVITELEVERANLKALFESTKSIIGLFDRHKRLLEFNKAFADYSRIADGHELKIGMDVLSHVEDKVFGQRVETMIDRALNGEKFKEMIEYPTSKRIFYFLMSFNPIYRGAEIVGVSLFAEDITQLKESQKALEMYNQNLEVLVKERTEQIEKKNVDLEVALKHLNETQQQLLQSEKMASLGTLSAGIGHEINNPLNFIKNGMHALLNELDKSSMQGKDAIMPFVEIIEEGVQRASSIVKSLSHFSRKGVSMNEKCDIHDILDNCLVILNSQLKYNIEVVKNYNTEPLILMGSEGKLHQAFLNIITNAVQSIGKAGKITIATSIQGKKLRIAIKDTGSGIPQENIDRISDPFYTTKEPGKGTGLGLFITYSIIEEHKGKIYVNSKLNEGTEFIVEI